MKKLLSAVTSFVMSATLMTSAFASSVSAAGGLSAVQPNVSIGEVSDVSANKNASNSDFTIDFGNYTANPGDKITVKPTITGNGSKAIASVDVDFKISSPLTITAIGGKSPAFGGEKVETNLSELMANMITLTDGEPTVPENGEALFQLSVQVPSNCPDGVYNVSFGNKVEIYKRGTDSETWTYNQVVGKITVGNGGSNQQQTTTQGGGNNSSNADFTIDFGNYTANAGDKITVKPTITGDGKKAIASIDVDFKVTSPLKITAIGGKSSAFGGEKVETNLSELKANMITLTDGEPTVPENGEPLFQLSVQVPSDCPDGVYNISFGNKVEIYKSGSDSAKWGYNQIVGKITVGNGGNNQQQTTSQGGGNQSSDADFTIDFGKYTAQPGDKITVKPTITGDGSKAIASVDVDFKVSSPLKISAIGGKSPAFGGEKVETNLSELKANMITLTDGEPTVPEDGEALFQLSVQIPSDCPDGVYNISFGNKVEIYKRGTDSDKWGYNQIVGKITVGNGGSNDDTTTTTTTTKGGQTSDADFTIDFGKYTAKPGDKIIVKPTITGDGTKGISSVDVDFKVSSPLKISAIGGKSAAFGGEKVESNLSELKANMITLTDGEPTIPENGEALFQLSVQIPSDCPDGVYNISFGNKVEIYKRGTDSDKWSYNQIVGVITVGEAAQTTTTAATTTTSKPDTTTTTVTTTGNSGSAAEGTVEWVIPTVDAKPGETVKMDVVVKNSDLAVAGAQFVIKAKDPIAYASSASGTGYDSTLVANGKTQQFAFGQGVGNGIKAANGSTVLTLTYTVPADCAAGTYPVTWSNAFISDTNGFDITKNVKLTDGAINVAAAGDISWVLDKVTAAPGETVTLKAVISDPKASGLGVAGAQFSIKADGPIEYVSITGTDAYASQIVANAATKQFAFAEPTGANVATVNGKTVLSITYKVPADCPAGDYNVVWSDAFISDTNGASLTDQVTLVSGLITVKSNKQDGTIVWDIPEVDAEPGETVSLNVVVKDNNGAAIEVAGAQFNIKADTVQYSSIKGSTAYAANIVANDKTQQFAFAEGVGSGVAAANNASVFTITYKVPEDCADGTYPVTWDSAFITDTYGNDITENIVLDPGSITVKRDTPVVPDGSVLWKIDTVTAKPGDTVTINMVVVDEKGAKLPIGGAQFVITETSPIVYGSVNSTSEAYGAAIVANPATKQYAFADSIGSAVASENGKKVLTLTYTVPTDCPAGKYPIKISDLFVSSGDGLDLTEQVLTANGAIIVEIPSDTTTAATTTTTSGSDTTTAATTTTAGGSDTTTAATTTTAGGSDTTTAATTTTAGGSDTTTAATTTTAGGSDTTTAATTTTAGGSETTTAQTTTAGTTVSTTSTTLPKGAVLWKIDTVTAKPGETVTVNMVVIDSNNTHLPIGGAQFVVKPTNPITYTSTSELSDAYEAAIQPNPDTLQFAFANPKGTAVPSENGKYVISFQYTVPEDCAAGTYPVTISDLFVSSADGANMTERVLTENGAIIVEIPSDTTTAATTTTTGASDTTTAATTTTAGGSDTTTAATTTTAGGSDTTTAATTTTVGGSDTTTAATTTTAGGSDTTTAATTTTAGGSDTTTAATTTTAGGSDTTTAATTTTAGGSETTTAGGSDTTTAATTTTAGGSETTTAGGSETTTAATTTTAGGSDVTTTTTISIPANGVAWQGQTVKAKQGDTVTVAVKVVDLLGSKLPISGAEFTIDFDNDKLELIGCDGSAAYNTKITYNPETGLFEFSNGLGSASIAKNGDDVIVFTFKVKDDCPNGTYMININDLKVTDKDGNDISNLVAAYPGRIIVDGSGTRPFEGDVFAEVTKTHGFYFSHDNGTRNNGQKGGFSPKQITSLKLYTRITEDGISSTEEWAESDIDMSLINFGDATPMSTYDENNGTFKYEVPVYYGNAPLVDRYGDAITVTVYIGVKGDIDLDGKVLAYDAALALAFYAGTSKTEPAKLQISTNPMIKGADDVLDDFCAFLGDVDANEWSEENWGLTKAERRILANDAAGILAFYAQVQKQGANADLQQIWDSIVPERFGA